MNSKVKKSCVFTHCDMDGAMTYLVLSWFYPKTTFEINVIRGAYSFREQYLNWCLNHKPSDYESIFILDLDVSESIDLIDHKNFFIVDHHITHEKVKYVNAKAFVKKYSSACKLLWKILSAKFPNTQITEKQKKLIAIVDDYDSYTLKSPLSKQLNTLYWNTSNNFDTFCKQFNKGFLGFTIQQQTIIKLNNDNLNTYYKNIKEMFVGTIIQDNKSYSVGCVFAERYINDITDLIFDNFDYDVAIVYNPNSNKISVRRNRKKDLSINISKLCESWGGGGHEGAGGAEASEPFIELSKTFKTKQINM